MQWTYQNRAAGAIFYNILGRAGGIFDALQSMFMLYKVLQRISCDQCASIDLDIFDKAHQNARHVTARILKWLVLAVINAIAV